MTTIPSPNGPARPAHQPLYPQAPIWLAVLLVLCGVAFYPSYLSRLRDTDFSHHLHGIAATLWLLLLLTQTILVRQRLMTLHRSLGRASLLLAPVFVVSGLAAGIAALLSLGYYGSSTSADGTGYELNVIAAAVVGGASLSGGKGSALGALLGALIIQMISSGIVILGIDQNYSQIIIGGVVILAVLLVQANQWIARKRMSRA